MTEELWARCTPAPFRPLTVLLLMVFLILEVNFGDSSPVRPLRYTPYTADRGIELAALRVLRDMTQRSTVTTPSRSLPTHQPAQLTNRGPGDGNLRRLWWWYPETPPQQAKKRENFSSYNWNSFGLRYGK